MTDIHSTRLSPVPYAAYRGPSMYPTLREPALMHVVPYEGLPVRTGDVVLFRPPGRGSLVVHRVVGVDAAGVRTRGDNNARDDTWLLAPGDIVGRVVAAWYGSRRRPVVGGRLGLWVMRWVGWRRALLGLLRPLYRAVVPREAFGRLLPARLRPRVLAIDARGDAQLCVAWGRRVLGCYDVRRQRWHAGRLLRLLVDREAIEALAETGLPLALRHGDLDG